MKALSLSLIAASCMALSSHAMAAPQTKSLTDFFGGSKTEQTEQTPATDVQGSQIMDLVGMVSDNLGVTEAQSQGGIASIFNYVKGNVSGSDFSSLAGSIPGLDSLMSMVPDTAASTAGTSSGLSGLLDKASQYSSSVKSINDLKNQFAALGLTPDMISSFVSQISSYLNTEENTETQSIFKSGLDNLLGSL